MTELVPELDGLPRARARRRLGGVRLAAPAVLLHTRAGSKLPLADLINSGYQVVGLAIAGGGIAALWDGVANINKTDEVSRDRGKTYVTIGLSLIGAGITVYLATT